jgi:hypothetical protein
MTLGSCLFRFLLGGTLVSLFAALGGSFKPKTFAGLFGSAPPIALVSLAIAFAEHGRAHVADLARSMVLGAAAQLGYSALCVALLAVRQAPVLLGAALAWAGWALVAGSLYFGLLG